MYGRIESNKGEDVVKESSEGDEIGGYSSEREGEGKQSSNIGKVSKVTRVV